MDFFIQNLEAVPKLVSLNKFLEQLGVTSTTGWRWRKRGLLQTTNIYGRLYLTDQAISDFLRRATAGEFAVQVKPGQKPATKRILE